MAFYNAYFDEDDRFHKAVSAVIDPQGGTAIVPDVTLVEVMFLARRAGGIRIRFQQYFESAGCGQLCAYHLAEALQYRAQQG